MEHLLWSSQIEFQLLCRFWVLICITKGHHCLCKLDIYSHSRVENVQYACTQLVQATVLPTRKHKRHPNYKKLLPSNFQVSVILPMLQQHVVNDITLTLIFRNFQKSSKGEILIFQVQNSSEMTIISLTWDSGKSRDCLTLYFWKQFWEPLHSSRPELTSFHHHRSLTIPWLQQIVVQHLYMYVVVNR